MKNYKNEASLLKSALLHSKLKLYNDTTTCIWDDLLSDIEIDKANHCNLNYLQSHNYEYPLVDSECPDIVYETENCIIGIEHFSIDSSKKTRKGSSYFTGKKTLDKNFISQHHSNMTSYSFLKGSLPIDLTYKNFCKTLLDTFNKHYKNIPIYKQNLSTMAPNKVVLLAFYIEDITSHGNYIVNSLGRTSLNPLLIPEFIKILYDTQGLDYILTRTQFDCTYTLDIHPLSRIHLTTLSENSYDLSKDFFLSYTPDFFCSIGSLDEEK